MKIQPGTRVGEFEVVAQLGAGGMGEVYRAVDLRLSREVALKILRHSSADPDSLRRFEKEAQAASALNHPNIVTIYEVGRFEGEPYIAMELVEGHTLRTLMRDSPLPIDELLRIAAKFAEGLAAAHARGIVHRDLKPDNVMISRDGFVKILDFGLAKLIVGSDDNDDTEKLTFLTRPGTILGTVQYMSPEQARFKTVDFHSDQFAFGSILYEMITGRLAFERDSPIESLAAIIHDEPQPIDEVVSHCPEPLIQLVNRCLRKEPEQRYATTADLAAELRAIRRQLDPHAGPISVEVSRLSRTAPAVPRPRHHMRWIAAAVVTAMVASAGGYYAYRRGNDSLIPAEKYLAVLPFAEAGSDAKSNAFADGLSEFLSSRLSTLPNVQVMSPALLTPGSDRSDIRKVAHELGANLVVRGVVQRSDNQLRVSYSVINVERGAQITAGTLTAPASQLFSIEDRIIDGISTALKIGEIRPVQTAGIDTAEDQEAFIRAIGLLDRYKDEAALGEALEILRRLVARAPDSALVNAALARASLMKYTPTHDPALARDAELYANRAVSLDAREIEAHLQLGWIRLRTGRADEALAEFTKCLEINPSSTDAISGLAEVYSTRGELAKAELQFRKAIDLRPTFWAGYNKLGAFYFAHGRFEESAHAFTRVIELMPNSPRGYTNAGGAYEILGRYDEARAAFSKAIALRPTGDAYSNLGTCYYFMGRYDDAAMMYELATRQAAHRSTYWANLGDAYTRIPSKANAARDAYTVAAKRAQEELTVNAHDLDVQATLARCQIRLGENAAAEKTIAGALAGNPKNMSVYYNAAVVANATNRRDDTLRFLARWLDGGHTALELRNDPEFAALRTDPGFQRLISTAPKS